jgi:transcriptional regulator with XRE-family HTH domain
MDDSIGARLQAWRTAKGLSQAGAAKMIGAKQRTWADWESGLSSPEVDFAEAIERLTDRTIRMTDWAESRRARRLERKKAS